VTQVELNYDLVRPLDEPDIDAIAKVHTWYGMSRVKLAPTLDKISVQFDASRLSEKEVEAVLVRFGIPIQRKWQVP